MDSLIMALSYAFVLNTRPWLIIVMIFKRRTPSIQGRLKWINRCIYQGAVIFSKPNGPLGERSGHSKNNSRLYCFGLCRSQTLPPDPLGCEQPIFRFILKIDRKNIKNTFLTIATASGHTYTYQRTIDLTSRSIFHALLSYQCCENTTFKVPPEH